MAGHGDSIVVAGIRITSPRRVLFDELGLTKEGLARYYEAVAEWMVPDLRHRPLSLVRCAKGPGDACVFLKHVDATWAPEIERTTIPESEGERTYAVANSAAGVVGLVQRGVIELHAWSSTTHDLQRPDRMVFDLDPGPGVEWREVMAAARLSRDVFTALGLEAFPKTSGSRGLHIAVPLAPKHDWDEVKTFSRRLAEFLAEEDPRLFTVRATKRERAGRIYVDYLRNAPGSTTVAAYSVRAISGAPVSTPLHWDEVGGRLKPMGFRVDNVVRRLHGLHSDPWKAFRRTSQTLTATMKKRIGLAP